MIAKTFSEKVMQVFIVVFLTVFSIAFLLPVWHVLMYSLSENTVNVGIFLFPHGLSFAGYRIVVRDPLLWRSYLNTIFVTGCGTILNLVMTFLASYPLTRQDLKGRKIIQYMIFFTMLFNGGVIPTFLVVRALGMVDSLWALIIPGAVSAYNIFVLRNFIQGIPESLMEAARIEGAGEFYILMRIIVPLSTPVIAVLGLLYGVGHWNSWFSCIIYINSTQHYVLQALLRQILFSMGSNNYFGYDPDLAAASMPVIVQMCVVVIATAPILCLYPFLQGYFVKGVTLGAVKG